MARDNKPNYNTKQKGESKPMEGFTSEKFPSKGKEKNVNQGPNTRPSTPNKM